jgi:hypothetical protein
LQSAASLNELDALPEPNASVQAIADMIDASPSFVISGTRFLEKGYCSATEGQRRRFRHYTVAH